MAEENIQLRDGSTLKGYPGRDHRQGAKTFFSKKNRGSRLYIKLSGRRLFSKKSGGEDLSLQQNLKIHDFIFQKRAIFEDQKVIYVWSSD